MAQNNPIVRVYESDDTTPIVISARAFRVQINRGRRNGLDTIEAGTCTIEFRNNDGEFDPWNSAEPYYDDIAPGAKVEVFQQPLLGSLIFVGRVESWKPGYAIDGTSIMRLECVDGLAELARVNLSAWSPVQQSVGARVSELLARPELDEFTWSESVEAGATTVGAFPVPAGTPAFDYLQRLARSEQGFCYMSRAGVFTFKGRYSAAVASNIEFRNTGTATAPKISVPFQRFTARASLEDVYNRVVSATEAGGTRPSAGTVYVNESAADIGSVRRTVTFEMTDLLTATDNQANDLGKLVLQRYAPASFRVTSVDVLYDVLSATDGQTCVDSDIGDLVRFVFMGPSGTNAYDAVLRVEGIVHQIDVESHRITWLLSPNVVDLDGLFILDSSSLGGADVLGY